MSDTGTRYCIECECPMCDGDGCDVCSGMGEVIIGYEDKADAEEAKEDKGADSVWKETDWPRE